MGSRVQAAINADRRFSRRRRALSGWALSSAVAIASGLVVPPAFAQPFTVARDLTVSSMIAEADPLVKAVMAILLLASIATWTILVAKSAELASAKRRLRGDVTILDQATSMGAAADVRYPAVVAMVDLARREIHRSGGLHLPGAIDGVKERVAARLSVIETNAIQSMLVGLNLLASIGATSPFIGLVGTVWGIMNSFIGISKSHATNLAIVAPGIAEALLATAMGLIAAIPAVLIYNMLARSIAGYRRLIAEAAVLTACALSHELVGKADNSVGEVRASVRATA